MSWEADLIKDYLNDRNLFMKNEWLTISSYIRRFRKKTREREVLSLLNAEIEFNNKWVQKVRSKVESAKIDGNAKSRLLLIIETHIKKHKERAAFLVVYGALVALVLKLLLSDFVLAIYITFVAVIIALERVFSGNITTALEELKSIVDTASKT